MEKSEETFISLSMLVSVLGVSHEKTSLAKRENFILLCQREIQHLMPHVFLSTCNRVEVYFQAAYFYLVDAFIFKYKTEYSIYVYEDKKCFEHLAAVTCGFKSAIFGETEIQGQVKKAYADAQNLNFQMHYFFQKALTIGKTMRTLFSYHFCSWNFLIIDLLKKKMNLKKDAILFVGSSSMNQHLIVTLSKQTDKLYLTSRYAQDIKKKPKLHFLYETLENWPRYKAVVVATNAQHYLLTESVLQKKTQLIIDLSVPRCVDPKLANTLELYNIDDVLKLKPGRIIQEKTAFDKMLQILCDRYHTLFLQKQGISKVTI